MRRVTGLVLAVLVLAFSVAAKPTPPTSFSDNFRDGDLVGWWVDHPDATPNWRVVNGVLFSPLSDHKALVDQMVFSSQAIQTSVYLNPENYGAHGGVTLWYQDAENHVTVVVYPASHGIMVFEVVDGEFVSWPYGDRRWWGEWYRLRVEADSVTGALAIYVDGVYQGTHYAQTTIRAGFSGLTTGNGMPPQDYTAAFDNFKVARLGGGKKK